MTQKLFVANTSRVVGKADVDGCSLFVHYSFEISSQRERRELSDQPIDRCDRSLAAMLPSGPFAADDDYDGVATRISKGEEGGGLLSGLWPLFGSASSSRLLPNSRRRDVP